LRAVRKAAAALPFTGSFPLVIVAAQYCERAQAEDVGKLCAATTASGPASKAAAELGEAILLQRFGSPAEAIPLARSAAAGFAEMGWPRYENMALELTGESVVSNPGERLGPRGKPAASAPADRAVEVMLTPRELDVARLVAGGGTNRRIAQALNVSVKTVEKSLSSIYEKLAITSRSQLTARIIAEDSKGRRATG
jgi:DNA-binding NarL/FixJ family response regulator